MDKTDGEERWINTLSDDEIEDQVCIENSDEESHVQSNTPSKYEDEESYSRFVSSM